MNNAYIFATYDQTAGVYGQVVVDLNDNVAKRNFLYAVSQSAQLQYMAKDLELQRIAEIDLHTGVIVPCVPHQVIARGSEAMNET